MKKINSKFALQLFAASIVLGLAGFLAVQAATTINLGAATSHAILAGSAITNTGSTVINGDVGLMPGTAITGFPAGVINGVQNIANPLALLAKTDLTTAYNNAAGQLPVVTVPTELGGTTRTAGVYNSVDGTFGITGTLTLDAQNDPSAVFIFKTASTLITGGSSKVSLTNGAQACNVFWQVGSSATLGTNSIFKGNILALTSATLTTGANVEGRVLAQTGAVALDTNNVTLATCAAAVAPVATTTTPIVATTTPTPVIATTTPAIVASTTPTPVVATTTSVIIKPVPAIATPAPVVTTSTPVITTSTPGFPETGFVSNEDGPSKTIFAILGFLAVIPFAVTFAKRRYNS